MLPPRRLLSNGFGTSLLALARASAGVSRLRRCGLAFYTRHLGSETGARLFAGIVPERGVGEACLNEELAAAFAYGDLDDKEVRTAEEHIDSCNECELLVVALARLATHSHGPTQPSECEYKLGDRIGRFELLGVAGRGAMSVVYEAYDPDLDRKVALKVLRAGDTLEPRRVARLLTEARTLARLSHDNVIVVHDVGTHAGSVFIAMEYIRGQTLSKWLRERRPSRAEILRVLSRAGAGLQAAHEAGLVHRDFKPDNVLIALDGRVRVSDFGLAQLQDDASLARERVGTPAYVAPEQWQGRADAASDQFSFCVALHESLCGKRPFAGDTISEIMDEISAGRIDGSAGTWLNRLLARGLAADPTKRFRDMSTLLAALEAGMRHRARLKMGLGVSAALLLAGVGGSALTVSTPKRPVVSCAQQVDSSTRVWSSTKKQNLREAMLKKEGPFSEAAWEQIDSQFERYAREWNASRTQVCVRERSGQDSAENNALMTQCLDDGLRDVDAMVEVLANNAAVSASASVKAVARISRPSHCTDLSRVGNRRLQDTNTLENRLLLARAKALYMAAAYAKSLETSVALVAQAKAEGDREGQVAALLQSCVSSSSLDQLDEAGAWCHEAALVAAAPGYAPERAEAWSLLVALVGGQQANYEEAELWARYAQTAIDTSGGAKRIEAMLSSARSIIARQQDRLDEAKQHGMRALELTEEAFGPEDLRVARSLNNLALVEDKLGEKEAALSHHVRALEVKEAILGKLHPDVAVSLANLGILHASTEPKQARDYYERSLHIVSTSLPKGHRYVAILLNNIANVERRLGNFDAAALHLERAQTIAELKYGQEHPTVATVCENLGVVRQQQGKYDVALALHKRALRIREAVYRGPHADVANSYNNLGFALLELDRLAEAEKHFAKGLALRQKVIGDEHIDSAWEPRSWRCAPPSWPTQRGSIGSEGRTRATSQGD